MENKHDVILGKTWFTENNHRINWRNHDVVFSALQLLDTNNTIISFSNFDRKIRGADFEEVYRVKISQVSEPPDITDPRVMKIVQAYLDVMPEKLPDELSLHRRVEFEMTMKPNALPSNRPPFRLWHTEQEALCLFVEEKHAKGWIKVSDSPWVSNIFGIPKKDPSTGTALYRAEWISSGNATNPIRWVIDYRHVNSQTVF